MSRRTLELRSLATRWRHHEPRGGVWTRRRAAAAALLVFAVPLVSRGGDTVERHVVGVRVEGLSRTHAHFDDAVEAARVSARRRLRARRNLVSVRLQRLARVRVDIEQAIADHLLDCAAPGELQSGLFDRAAARRHDDIISVRADIVRATRARITNLDESAIVEIGPAELVAAWLLP